MFVIKKLNQTVPKPLCPSCYPLASVSNPYSFFMRAVSSICSILRNFFHRKSPVGASISALERMTVSGVLSYWKHRRQTAAAFSWQVPRGAAAQRDKKY
jgi:hypothetical protein